MGVVVIVYLCMFTALLCCLAVKLHNLRNLQSLINFSILHVVQIPQILPKIYP